MKQLFFLFCFTIFISALLSAQSIPEDYARGMNAYNSGEYAKAYDLFSSFNKLYTVDDELNSTSRYYAAESLLRLDRVDAAVAAFEFFTSHYQLSNFRPEALYKLGTLYFGKKEYSNAREKFSLLIDKYPESEYAGSSFYFIGDSYTKENNLDEAVRFFKDAFASKKNNKYLDNSVYSLANIYEKTGNYKMAVAYYDTLLAYYKNSSLAPHAQVRIGLCYFELKEYDNAVLELNDPLILQLPAKQLTEAKYVLANAYYRLKEYKEAEETFNTILRDNPKTSLSKMIRYDLGWVKFQKGNYDEAYKIFNSLSRMGREDTISVNSLFWSAEAKRYLGDEKDAALIYNEFLNNYPNNYLASRVKYQIGVVNFNGNKSKVSEDYLLQSIESGDISVKGRALTLLGELRLNNKDYLKAKQYFNNALGLENLSAEMNNRAQLGISVADYFLNLYDETIKILSDLSSRVPQFEASKVHFYLAESYFSKKDYSKALKEYGLIENGDTDLNPQVIYGKAYAYYNLRKFNDASYYFSDYIKKYPGAGNYKDAKLRLADSYYGEKKFNDAGRIYKEIFLSDNSQAGSDYAYYQYAQALYKAGNSAEAINEFNNLQQKFPDSKYVSESQYIIGWIYFQKGNFKQSISSYHRLIEQYPSSPVVPVAYNSIGNAYFNLGLYDSSVAYYYKVLKDYPSSNYVFDAISGIKDAYVVSDRPDDAILVINDFVSRNPGAGFTDQIAFKKGEIYYSRGDYEKAKASYKEFIAAFPSSSLVSDGYYWVGKSAENLQQNEEALYNFNLVFNSHLNSEVGISSVLEMGRIHSALKNYDNAIQVYSVAIDKLPPESPKVTEIIYNRAMAYVAKNDMNKAYDDFNYLIQYYPSSVFTSNAKFEVALLELARKNYETCDMLFKELSENRTDDLGAKAQYYYGVSLFDQNKIDDAITALVRVRFAFSGFDEWLTNSYLKLGECYEKKGDNAKAKEMYKIVLSHHKGDSYGLEAQNKLKVLE